MAAYDLKELFDKYDGFTYPIARIYLGGKNPEEDKKISISISNLSVEVTSEFKASIASFTLYGGFDNISGSYDMEKLKKYAVLGQDVRILLGHAASLMEVFRGYVAMVNFQYDPYINDTAGIRITAMDVKGIMMVNNTSRRLKANYYSDAVNEILEQAPYENLKNREIITDIAITDTPDKPAGGAAAGGAGGLGGVGAAGGLGGAGGAAGTQPDNRIEVVAESDYEFVVKVCKKFNYEFFSIGGNIAFRKAKANTQELINIFPSVVIRSFDIGYDLTGVAGAVKVRNVDVGKGSKIEVTKKNTGTFSLGNKAKPIISKQTYVYTDTAVDTQSDADMRAAYIMEEMSYRLGTLNMTLSGMPELVPGRFITLTGFGDGASNTFYLTDVIHEFDEAYGYTTTIIGKAATIAQGGAGGGGALGGLSGGGGLGGLL